MDKIRRIDVVSFGASMSHQVAKLLLEHAGTFLERTEAIKSAMQLGMPLNEIEEYLDWIDMVRNGCDQGDHRPRDSAGERETGTGD